ncbi:MAG: hypothetical protein EON91_00300 [Brevundimonas sp.]|uniref:hypothetical protein n=1 Tax=Brevundimonas sp. TaxID=1871086 RepID=UPI00122A2AA1|nr:hypothetical protein [Brevundimonas sp.]RZJ19706.1 MAG: hypothetical protein EON91_00300 [Brevundimonas sp.]
MTDALTQPELLLRIAGELTGLIGEVEGLSDLAQLLAARSAPDERPGVLIRAQSIDAASQRLTALADVLAALGNGRSAATALATVSLSDLSDRLHGAAPAPARAADGDLILFD